MRQCIARVWDENEVREFQKIQSIMNKMGKNLVEGILSAQRRRAEYFASCADYEAMSIFQGWPIGSPPQTISVEEKKDQPITLKEAEDKVQYLLNDLSPSLQALVYKILYNGGLRISAAEDLVRRGFKVS